MSETLAVNSNISYYRISQKIGAGGMGEVYLAQDTKLDRKVALKILPSEFAEDTERMNRFVREAKSASALNHPNIITIHEIGESEGTHYIATEFIEGETLHDRLKEKSLSLKSALDIAVQIVSALQAAHSANIIHRDIKPENVMIRADGLVKILDFGIAKLSEQKIESIDQEATTAIKPPSTNPGMIIGTANYMSPEQAKGKEIDARSDIFSFGIVLYEMLTSKRAFEGETPLEIISSILKDEPKPIHQLRPALPREIERIVSKTLRKGADERYQTARGLLTDLKDAKQELEFQDRLERTTAPNREEPKTQLISAPTTDEPQSPASSAEFITQEVKKHKLSVAVSSLIVLALLGIGLWFFFLRLSSSNAPIDSIAVLPFQNRSSDADTEYLSDGLAESLIYRLSQLPHLKVSPTSSVFRYKGKENDPIKVGSELGVHAVMTGRIVQRGDNLTVSVELVDVRNNKLLWGEQYERKTSELLATQREIATEISRKLELKLSGNEKDLTKRYTNNNEAYQFYLKGRYHFAKRTKASMLQAADYYRQAIAIDPNFALAFARIAEVYLNLPTYPYTSPSPAIQEGKGAAEKALAIDPNLAEAHTFMGFYLAAYEWKWAEAEREFKRAIELDPNSSAAHFRYGQLLLLPTGRLEESVAEMGKALELEPLDIVVGSTYAYAHMLAGQKEKGLEMARKTLELEPNHPVGRHNLAMIYNANGMYDDALTICETALEDDPTSQWMLGNAGVAYARSGRAAKAEEVLRRFREREKTEYVAAYNMANVYVAMGRRDEAFAMLEKAYQSHDWWLQRLKVDPYMDPLRDDPRFVAMSKRLNFPE
ncbi:MAG: protein kinase [Pyrinomonadaceae bacterium]